MDNIPGKCHPGCRVPYVSAHIEGAKLSSEMDCEEAELLEKNDPKRIELLESSRAWLKQAELHRREETRKLEQWWRDSKTNTSQS